MGLATFQKLQKQQSNELKKKILTEFAISIDALVNDEELEPWTEVVDEEAYTLTKIENMVSFGALVLTFASKDNPDHEIRLPLQLKL